MTMGYMIGGASLAETLGRTTTLDHAAIQADIDKRARHSMIAIALVREIAIKEALGRWVSEIEPVLVYNHLGQFVGLTHAGQEIGGYLPICVEIRGGFPI